MHACGHDTHTAMMLGVAKLLKKFENKIKGTVKIIFQPGEEIFQGAKAMVKAGVLENPKVDAALTCHIQPNLKEGIHVKLGIINPSSHNFKITVKGKASHGAMPYNGIDPIMIASQIVVSVQEIITRELPLDKSAVLTFGRFEAGKVNNAIPSEAIIEGTMRTFSVESQNYLEKRLPEFIKSLAGTYRGEVNFEYTATTPVTINNEELSKNIMKYIYDLSEDQTRFKIFETQPGNASEDFGIYSKEVPGFSFKLAAPNHNVETLYPLHHPKMMINEDILALGTAIHVNNALQWLNNN